MENGVGPAPTTEGSQQLEHADLLSSQLRADSRVSRMREEQSSEQRAALARAEAALEAYLTFFYPSDYH